MRIVVAVDERLDETPLGRVPALLNVRGADVLLVHVLDPAGREEWERAAGRHLLRPHAPHLSAGRMHAADQAEGERVLAAAAAAAAGWSAAHVETRLLEGSRAKFAQALVLDGAAGSLATAFNP